MQRGKGLSNKREVETIWPYSMFREDGLAQDESLSSMAEGRNKPAERVEENITKGNIGHGVRGGLPKVDLKWGRVFREARIYGEITSWVAGVSTGGRKKNKCQRVTLPTELPGRMLTRRVLKLESPQTRQETKALFLGRERPLNKTARQKCGQKLGIRRWQRKIPLTFAMNFAESQRNEKAVPRCASECDGGGDAETWKKEQGKGNMSLQGKGEDQLGGSYTPWDCQQPSY